MNATNQAHFSIPVQSSTRPPTTTTTDLNKEVIPGEQTKLNPSKSLFEKRTDAHLQPATLTGRQANNNSWALFRGVSSTTTTTSLAPTSPTLVTSTTAMLDNRFNKSAKLLSNNAGKECKDVHQLCCFWVGLNLFCNLSLHRLLPESVIRTPSGWEQNVRWHVALVDAAVRVLNLEVSKWRV